jgi:hypothetical protein
LTANGRRRKKLIHSLEKEGGRLPARNIFRRLFIATTRIYLANILRKGVSMGRGAWETEGRLSGEDNIWLTRPFTEEEVKKLFSV